MAGPSRTDVDRMRRIIERVRSYGVQVREMPGWETRGFTYPGTPKFIFDHHDASSRKSGEWGSLGLILDGTPRGIPGPLSNFQVARCLDGVPKLAVVCSGYAYHAGTGGPTKSLSQNNANPWTFGAEKANDGLGEPYTAAANYATNALFHAAAVESGAIPESFPLGHKEWTSRKSDPTYSMADRRREVGGFTPTSTTPTPEDDEDMSTTTVYPPGHPSGLTQDVLIVPPNHRTLLVACDFDWQNLRLVWDWGSNPDGSGKWTGWPDNGDEYVPIAPGRVSRAPLAKHTTMVSVVHLGPTDPKAAGRPVRLSTAP